MVMADVLHSCTHADIAEAAVASIGGAFATRLRAEAAHVGLPVGVLVGSLVSRFAREAGERDWRELSIAMARSDQPVLCGVEVMAERMLAARERFARRPSVREAVPPGRPATPSLAVLSYTA